MNSNDLLDEVYNNIELKKLIFVSFLIFFLSIVLFLPKIYYVGKNYYANKKYYMVKQDYDILSSDNRKLKLILNNRRFIKVGDNFKLK